MPLQTFGVNDFILELEAGFEFDAFNLNEIPEREHLQVVDEFYLGGLTFFDVLHHRIFTSELNQHIHIFQGKQVVVILGGENPFSFGVEKALGLK